MGPTPTSGQTIARGTKVISSHRTVFSQPHPDRCQKWRVRETPPSLMTREWHDHGADFKPLSDMAGFARVSAESGLDSSCAETSVAAGRTKVLHVSTERASGVGPFPGLLRPASRLTGSVPTCGSVPSIRDRRRWTPVEQGVRNGFPGRARMAIRGQECQVATGAGPGRDSSSRRRHGRLGQTIDDANVSGVLPVGTARSAPPGNGMITVRPRRHSGMRRSSTVVNGATAG